VCEPFEKYFQRKLIPPDQLAAWRLQQRQKGLTVATLNGSFDLLHAGHLYIIYEASQQANLLLVALNSDASIKAYKSPDRPILCLEDRLRMLSALDFVDYVTWFEETDPRQLLQTVQPDVHVNGAEYGSECIEAPVVAAVGSRLHLVKRQGQGTLSTSYIIQRIKGLCA
jgi:rfaE bifunctional protein nucleotidyltransferase chain/domain